VTKKALRFLLTLCPPPEFVLNPAFGLFLYKQKYQSIKYWHPRYNCALSFWFFTKCGKRFVNISSLLYENDIVLFLDESLDKFLHMDLGHFSKNCQRKGIRERI